MNNIYIDEVPDSCFYCKFFNSQNYCCWLIQKDAREYRDDCPLIPITDRLAEERKKVVSEIREMAGDYFEMPYCDACGNTDFNDVVLTGKDLTEILDDIKRGE